MKNKKSKRQKKRNDDKKINTNHHNKKNKNIHHKNNHNLSSKEKSFNHVIKKPINKNIHNNHKIDNHNKDLHIKKLPVAGKDEHKVIAAKIKEVYPDKKDIVESYEIEVDKAKVKISITKGVTGHKYNVSLPEISIATSTLLEEVRNELITVTTVGMNEIIDPKAYNKIKTRFMKEATTILTDKVPTIEKPTQELLVGRLMQEMLGLGEIEFLINDPNLEEIVIHSAKKPIKVYHKRYGWLSTNIKPKTEEEIVNYSNIIARRVGRQINVLNPLLDAHLVTGDRVNAILYPISTEGNTITIRKFARDPYTIVDLIKSKTLNLEVSSLIWLAIEFEMNVLISGGTASGKTTMLNSFLPFIPPNHRIVSVEDTRELMLPDFLYWCPLVTRSPNAEGKGEVSMLDLLVNSLRMRPDRIIMGEMRRKEEAMVLFEAMHTGHSVYATLHADSAAETISRLTNPPLSVPPNLLNAVNLNLVVFRDRRKGIRRVFQVAEIEATDVKGTPNILYRWIPEEDVIIKHSDTSKFSETLTRITGMTEKEIDNNLKEKAIILQELINKNIRTLNEIGMVVNMYYFNKEELLKDIKKNDFKNVIKERLNEI